MLSKAIARILPMLLIIVSAAFATAPGWVAEGVVLEYSVDGDTVIFTVTERTSTEVSIEIDTGAPEKSMATENASLTNGQFWFDDSLLEDASDGDDIDEFEVTAEGTQTFAGKQWDTVTLEATLSGAKTVRIYDRDSGLMLKQTVQVSGAPVVTLTEYTVPDFEEAAPPPPEPPPAEEPTEPADETTEPTPPSEQPQPEPYDDTTQPDVTTPDTTPPADTTEEAEPGPPAKKPCIPAAALLMLLGFVFFRS
jgi:hypothetical protein